MKYLKNMVNYTSKFSAHHAAIESLLILSCTRIVFQAVNSILTNTFTNCIINMTFSFIPSLSRMSRLSKQLEGNMLQSLMVIFIYRGILDMIL